MEIKYKELVNYLQNFTKKDGMVYFKDNMSNEIKQLAMSADNNNIIQDYILYLKYVYFPSIDPDSEYTQLTIDFSDIDLNEAPDETFIDIVNTMYNIVVSNDLSLISPKDKLCDNNIPDNMREYVAKLNEIYNIICTQNYIRQGISIYIDKDKEFSKKYLWELISAKVDNEDINIKYLYITNTDLSLDVIYQIEEALNGTGVHFNYYTKEYSDYKKKQDNYKNIEIENSIANEYFFIHLGIDVFDGYEEFYKSYSDYQKAYDHICEWIISVNHKNTKSMNRFLVERKVNNIPCVEILFAWVTLTTGAVFVFCGSNSISYINTINRIINSKGDLMPAYLKFRLATKYPLIKDRLLLGVASLKFDNRQDKDTLVAVKNISMPIKTLIGVPLRCIFEEIHSGCDEGAGQIYTLTKGFYMGMPLFNNSEVISKNSAELDVIDTPFDTIDIIIDEFTRRCEDIYTRLKNTPGKDISEFYDKSKYSSLLDQFIYCFQCIFMHYMGYRKFYTINDIFILPMKVGNDIVNYACVLDFSCQYRVQPVDFILGEPVMDNTEIVVDNVISPEYLLDYMISKKDNGYEYPEINPFIRRALNKALSTITPNVVNDSIKIETSKSYNYTDNMDMSDAYDIYRYMYPVIYSEYQQTDNQNIIYSSDGTLRNELSIIFKELIYWSAKSSMQGGQPKYNPGEESISGDCSSVSCNMSLKQKVIHDLYNNAAIIGRNISIPNLFENGTVGYKGLRYLNPEKEAPIKWNGELQPRNGKIQLSDGGIPPTICRK